MDKSIWLQNNVTGDKYMIIYGASGKGAAAKPLTPVEPGYVTQRFPANQGQFQLRYVGRKMALPSLAGDAAEASHLGDIAAVLHQQRQDRHRARRHADRDHRLQGGRQVRRRAQQRVRLRQLRDHPGRREVSPLRRATTLGEPR